MLGGFRLELDSTTQDPDQKVQQKPVELLKALVAEGGESVPHSRLSDLLWPEADGDMAAHSFKTTLSQLRKLLGRNDFLVVQDGRLSLSRQFCWIDTWRLDEVTQVIAQAAQPGAPTPTPAAVEALIGRLRRACPAPLLPDDAADWVAAYRSRIHRRYERCLAQLSQLMERAGRQRSLGAAPLPMMDL
jgi:DNA-binding SARP family transcriptional activator